MKKKALAVLTALAVMTMGAMTVFAADSPSVETTQTPVSTQTATTSVAATDSPDKYASATSADDYTVAEVSETTVKAASVAVQNAILNDLATAGANLGNDTLKDSATNGSKVTATILTVVDIEPDSATQDANGNYTVTIKNASIKAGDIIAVLHYNGSSWETIKPSNVADGSVTFTASSLSPICIVKMDVDKVTSSPKTGETVPAAVILVVFGLTGAVITGKKVFA